MSILSAGTSGIFLQKPNKKEAAVMLKCIDQLPQNLTKVHNLVRSFDTNLKNFPIVSVVFYCSFIVPLLF